MAFQKKIEQVGNGISASYWRIGALHSDFIEYLTRVVLVGYVDASLRSRNARGLIDKREYNLSPEQLGRLFTGRPQFDNSTYFEINAKRLYEWIKDEPRSIPEGAIYDPETGELTIPSTGEVVAKADITFNEDGYPVAIPSEFKNAAVI